MIAAVIGCTGYVGAHVVQCLLQHNWVVRGLSRTASQATWLQSIVPSSSAVSLINLDLRQTRELSGVLDEALEGCDAVFFCAGTEKQDPATIDFMVGSTKAVMDSARRKGLGCVVITSSGGSTNRPGHKDQNPKNEIENWSDPDLQIEAGKYSPAAKTLMEISCLQAVGRNQQNEVVDDSLAKGAPRLCIINPNLILGPQLQPGPISGNSLPWVARILKGNTMTERIPNDSMSIIDVRDLAALHVACAEQETASGRYFGVDQSYPWHELLASFKKAYPSYRMPRTFEGEANDVTKFDHSRKNSLRVPIRSLDEVTKGVVEYLIEKGAI